MDNFALIRVQKLSTKGYGKGSIYRAVKHLDNHEKTADISRPELTRYNRSSRNLVAAYDYKKIISLCGELKDRHNQAVDERNENRPPDTKKERHLKETASQAFEVIMTFSPDMEQKISWDEWLKKNIEFINNEYIKRGCKIVRAEMHVDESSIHFHCIVVAYDKNRQRADARTILGGSADLSKLQDRYAEAMDEFGLARGVSRYNEYDRIRKRAIAAGYGSKTEDVQRYARDNDIELPKFRRHENIGKWKAEQEQEIKKGERILSEKLQRLEEIRKEIKNLEDNNNLYNQKLLDIAKNLTVQTERNQTMSVYQWLQGEERIKSYKTDLDDFLDRFESEIGKDSTPDRSNDLER